MKQLQFYKGKKQQKNYVIIFIFLFLLKFNL